jgi:hypothetical protein
MWIAWASQAVTLLRDQRLRRHAGDGWPRRDAVPRRGVLGGAAFGAAALAVTVLLLASLPPGL